MTNQSNNAYKRTTITAVGDMTCSDDAKKTFQNMVNEKPDVNLFLGDSSYELDATCFIDIFRSFAGLKEKTIFSIGNHDDKENESNDIKKQLKYFGITEWMTTKQIDNIYFICMNSQDPDWNLKMDQYLWFRSKLEEAIRLRDSEHRVDWIVTVHKSLYTLKGGHRPERKARDVYQPLFDNGQVDFIIYGHSHNMQRTLPIKSGGLDQEPIITASGLDFRQDHGQIYIISGAGGRILYSFEEPKNRLTSFAYDKEY